MKCKFVSVLQITIDDDKSKVSTHEIQDTCVIHEKNNDALIYM